MLTPFESGVETLGMDTESEARALGAVIDRLAKIFPDEERSVIEDVVAAEHGLFANNPVRDFVPVLVERGAKFRLTGSSTASPRPRP